MIAAPSDGAANRAVVKLVTKTLDVPKSAVSVASGAASRNKRLLIDGLGEPAVRARWLAISLSGSGKRRG